MKKLLMAILAILTIATGITYARRGGRGGRGGGRIGRSARGGRGGWRGGRRWRRGGYWGRPRVAFYGGLGYPYRYRRYGYPGYYPYSYGYYGPSYYQSDAYVPLDQLTQFKDRIKFLENFTHRTQNQQNELQHLHARVKQLEEGKAKAAAPTQTTKRIAPTKEPEKAYVASAA